MQDKQRAVDRRTILRRGAQLVTGALAALYLPKTLLAAGERASKDASATGGQVERRAKPGRTPTVTAVFGSGRRKGVSEAAAERLLAILEKRGAKVQRFYLTEMSYRGCQGCMSCKSARDECVLRDDLTAVLEAIRSADILVLASSVYFGELSSQMKGLMDRMYSFYHTEFWLRQQRSRLSPGKRLVLVLAQGNPDPGLFAGIGSRYAGILSGEFGFMDAGLVRCVAIRTSAEVAQNPQIDAEIRGVANRLLREFPAQKAAIRSE